eukprot:1307700-Amorphochlora_amoeboformis.AAC.3
MRMDGTGVSRIGAYAINLFPDFLRLVSLLASRSGSGVGNSRVLEIVDRQACPFEPSLPSRVPAHTP